MQRAIRSNDLRWAVIWLAWTAVAVLFSVRTLVALRLRGATLPAIPMVAIELVYWYVWALLTPVVIRIAIRFPLSAPRLARNIGYHALFSVLIGALHAGTENYICVGLLKFVFRTHNAELWRTIPPIAVSIFFYTFNGIVIYWVIVGLYQSFHFYRASVEKETRAAQLQAQLVNSELENLKSQLHPHFLFNSLNTIGILMRENVDAAMELLVSLGDLLRMALDRREHEIPLATELEFVRKYLQIEQTRFNDRLHVTIEVDEGLESAYVPSLIVQPLVENSIKHGISARSNAGRIVIQARKAGEYLQIRVRDDGPGMNGGQGARDGIGLRNVLSRLKQLYGGNAEFDLSNLSGGGCQATITLPLRKQLTVAG